MSHEIANQNAFDRFADQYVHQHLHPAERNVLERWRGRWADVEMLDLGVGAGRTAYVFSAIVKRYVGIDYAARMIDFCLRQVSETPQVEFKVGDASDLSFLGDRKFDFILFSFNGIDYVTHAKRQQVLREVAARARDRESLFLFSSHSLHSYPFPPRWRVYRQLPVRSMYWAIQDMMFNYRLKKANRGISESEIKKRGWAELNDGAHDFALSTYYVMPEENVRQIEEAGLELVEVWNVNGQPVDWRKPQVDHYLHYLCRPAARR